MKEKTESRWWTWPTIAVKMMNLISIPQYKDVLIKHRQYLRNWIEVSGDQQAESLVVTVE